MEIFTIKNKNNTLWKMNNSDKIVIKNNMDVLLKYKNLYKYNMNLNLRYMNHNINNKN